MTGILKWTILPISLLLLTVWVAYYLPKSDNLGVSNSSHKSKTSLSPREKNKDLKAKKSDRQTSDGNAKDPHAIIPSETVYDIEDINSMIKAAYLIDDDEKRCQTLKKIAHLWALIDPDACLEWSLSIAHDEVGYKYITAQVISTLAGNNQSEKAMQLLSGIPKGALRDTAIGYGIWGLLDLASPDLTTAERLLTMISSKEQMDRSAGTLSKELINSDRFYELKEMYDSLAFGTLKDSLGSSFIRALVYKDPLASLDLIRDNPELNNIENFQALAAGFAKLDPLRGINIADDIEEPEVRNQYISSLLNRWAAENHEEAGKWVIDQVSSKNFDQMKNEFFMIARRSFAHDHNYLFSQIDSINDLGQRNAATLTAAAALSEYDPRKAAELALATVVEQPETQADAMAITAKNWLTRDPLEASKWIGDLDGGPLRDAAVLELVANILSKDKDVAMASSWAAQVEDPKKREQAYSKIDMAKP